MTEIRDTYLTLAKTAEGLYKEKGSRFIALGFPIKNEQEALGIVKAVTDKYHDARHHCWAYRIGLDGEIYRVNDDGEPSGTAGRPIHGAMVSAGITDTLFVVVRYFGGIKLGTSGLIDAYRTAVKDALEKADITEKQVMKSIAFSYPYQQIGKIMKLVKNSGAEIIENLIEEPCRMTANIRAASYQNLIKGLSDTEGVNII